MSISGKAMLAGVIGWPVAHSRSPRLHNYWLSAYGLDGAYVPLAVKPESFAAALRALPLLGFRGANVTLPHKAAALQLVDQADDLARRVGAVNTIVIGADGSLHGRNTDAFGFMENLKQAAPAWRATSGPALVLGAGGGARAVIVALQDAGAPEIRVVNRNRARAEQLASDVGGNIALPGWDQMRAALADVTLLVNSTSLGMAGQPPLEIDLGPLPPTALVADLVYAPLQTELLRTAQRRGNATVDGLGMLLHQARPGFEAWFGRAPEVTAAVRDFVLA